MRLALVLMIIGVILAAAMLVHSCATPQPMGEDLWHAVDKVAVA